MTRATHLTCPSETGATLIRDEMRLGRRDIVAYPNPPAPPEPKGDRAPAEADPNLIVFVGWVTRGKGVEVLVRAFAALRELRPEVTLEVVGPDYPTGSGFASTQAYLEHLREEVLDQIEAFFRQAVRESGPRRPPSNGSPHHAARI